jgi:hypothetical protein
MTRFNRSQSWQAAEKLLRQDTQKRHHVYLYRRVSEEGAPLRV